MRKHARITLDGKFVDPLATEIYGYDPLTDERTQLEKWQHEMDNLRSYMNGEQQRLDVTESSDPLDLLIAREDAALARA